jgi:hypothetical protein
MGKFIVLKLCVLVGSPAVCRVYGVLLAGVYV